MAKTKKELKNNLEFCKKLLEEVIDEFDEKTKDKSDEANKLYYNTSLIKRNRVMINQYMKELERY